MPVQTILDKIAAARTSSSDEVTWEELIAIITELATDTAGKQPAGDYATNAALASGDNAVISTLRAGVAAAGDNLSKLYSLIQTLNTLVTGTTPDGDSVTSTIQEILSIFSTYPEGVDIATALAGKQPTGDYATNAALTSGLAGKQATGDYALNSALTSGLAGKQATLVSSTNIKTLNGVSLLGSGDMVIGSPYTPETQDYLTRIAAVPGGVGGVDAYTIDAIDRFWNTIDSFKAKCIRLDGFFGKNLASALVGLKAPAGLGTLTNNNFVAADWSMETSFSISSNTNKSLGTGIIPSVYGITNTNISIGGFILDDVYSLWHLISDNPVSAPPSISLNGTALTLSNVVVDRKARGWTLMNGGSGFITGYQNAVIQKDFPSSSLNAVTFNSEITYFKGTYTGTPVFGFGKLGLAWTGFPLTKAESKTLGKAAVQLMIDTGRYPAHNGIWSFMGDSNVNGNGLNEGRQSWPIIAAKKLGVMHYVAGAPSSQLTQTAAGVAGGIVRYLDLLDAPAGTHVLCNGSNDMNIRDNASITVANSSIVADYKAKLITIFNAFLDINKRVIVVGLPYCATSIAGAAKLDAYNQAGAEAAAAVGTVAMPGVIYIDAVNAMRDYPTPADLLQVDGLHLSALGHAFLAERVFQAEQGILYRKPSLDFPSIGASAIGSLTVTMFGARAGMDVNVVPQAALSAGLGSPYGIITAPDVVTVYQPNNTASPIDQTPLNYRVSVSTGL